MLKHTITIFGIMVLLKVTASTTLSTFQGDIEAQTRQTLENLDRVLEGFGVTKSNLAYVELYLTNPQEHFCEVIEMFKEYIGEHRPAGSSIGVTYLAFPEQLLWSNFS